MCSTTCEGFYFCIYYTTHQLLYYLDSLVVKWIKYRVMKYRIFSVSYNKYMLLENVARECRRLWSWRLLWGDTMCMKYCGSHEWKWMHLALEMNLFITVEQSVWGLVTKLSRAGDESLEQWRPKHLVLETKHLALETKVFSIGDKTVWCWRQAPNPKSSSLPCSHC